jgi:hypothetical protein
MSTDVATRRPGSHGAHVFSQRTRRRVLAALRDRAIAGDPAAAEVILKYGQPAPVRDRRHAHGDALVATLRARLDVADGESTS